MAGIERYTDYREPRDRTVDPADYQPLPPGAQLTYSGTGTCAVTAASTMCVVGKHGFELSSKGSRVF